MASDSASSASLAPGFRFHPTDEELVRYYLRRKVCGKPFRFDAISDLDIYKVEPWDLPGRSKLKTRDLEWYFFSVLDKKYGNGSRTNRATDRGYWKTTGKDRPVYHRTQMVGMKKTLVYHSGRAPRGERTNWVMHEYKLIDEELEKAGVIQDAFVLCRIFLKSGSGPKNGEQYGAPFVEEEWENDDLAVFPKEESSGEVAVDNDAYLDADDLEQILGADIPLEGGPLLLNFDDNGADISTEISGDAQELLTGMGENQPGLGETDYPNIVDLPAQYDETNATAVKREYIGQTSSNANSVDVDYLLEQPHMNASSNLLPNDGSFFESNDLQNALVADPGFDMLEEYLTYFDATADNLPYTFDSSIASDDLITDSGLAHEYVDEGKQQLATKSNTFIGENSNNVASSSSTKLDPALFASDIKYPFLKHASRMLGNIPAPPAFASEFPSKEAALHLASASHSKAINVTAGMIRIRNVSLTGSGLDMSFGKHGQVNIVLSFNMGDSKPADKSTSSAADLAVSRSWLYCIFLWVLILSMSFKLGSYFCSRSFMS